MGSSEHHILHLRVSPWKLTKREAEVMDALCSWGTTKGVGRAIEMAGGTVTSHLRDIFQKMDCHDRTVAACMWTRWRITGL